MSTSKTIGTILVSVILGAITFLIAAPKKVVKKREKTIAKPMEDNADNTRDLFI